MNNKIIEKSFLIHIAILIVLFVFLNNKFGYNIFNETSNAINEYEELALGEIDTLIDKIKNNPDDYDMDEFDLAEYKTLNVESINESAYLLYYYMPACYMLLVLLLVLVENSLYRRIKLKMLVKTYDAKKDTNKEKLKEIIREKFNFAYRRISLPKHVPYMCVILCILKLFIPEQNEILLRTINNMSFALIAIVTIFGIRVAVKFFKTKSNIARFLIIFTNVLLGLMVPQMYFIIGFLQSVMTIKIIVKTE